MLGLVLLSLATVIPVRDGGGYNCWPMIQVSHGKIVCVYSCGKEHDVGEGTRGVCARVSADAGITWSAERLIANDPAVGEAAEGKGTDASGAVLFWVRSWWGKGTRKHELFRMGDDESFEKVSVPKLDPNPIQITDVFSVGEGKLMSLWFAGSYRDDDCHSWGTLTSADGGRMWTQRTVEAGLTKSEWPTEPSAVYLGDGRILAIARRESAGPQLQLTSSDGGLSWQKRETDIRDIRNSTPSLVYDLGSGRVFNYYYERGKKVLKCRVADAVKAFLDPHAWGMPKVIARGDEERHYDAGNANATSDGRFHYVAYYSGSRQDTRVLVARIETHESSDLKGTGAKR